MGLLAAAILFLILTCLIAWFGYRHYVRPSSLLDQLKTSTSDALPSRLTGRTEKKSFRPSNLLEHLGLLLPISPQDAALAKNDLIAAGFRRSSAVAIYYGSKVCLSFILLVCALSMRSHIEKPVLRMVLPIGSAAFGWALNSFFLGRLVKKRHEKIRLSLPDVLDLMVICSEAGCGLDQSIVNVSRDLKSVHPAIAEELSMVNMEIMAGKSRADALRNLGKRCGEDEMKKLVAILIQTDRFGTSVSEALRTQSEFLRSRRRQEAEERAGKVGVKLVFPIFLFCLPALLIVTAGPAILQLFTGLFPAMNSLGH
jgi:tight adherence protein C